MDDKLVTCDLILNWLKEQVEQKRIVSPSTYVDACTKLNLLSGDEHDKLFGMQQEISGMKVIWMKEGDSVAAAKAKVEATDNYRMMKSQEAKIKRIEEAVRIMKIRARLKEGEFNGY